MQTGNGHYNPVNPGRKTRVFSTGQRCFSTLGTCRKWMFRQPHAAVQLTNMIDQTHTRSSSLRPTHGSCSPTKVTTLAGKMNQGDRLPQCQ